mmetsp:Transcript_13616/g.47041  ORF Transcript_13616/g.47041 Transcript_13616/m.47041 type:complete len:226 (+) Transcript_13616:162-839(+)
MGPRREGSDPRRGGQAHAHHAGVARRWCSAPGSHAVGGGGGGGVGGGGVGRRRAPACGARARGRGGGGLLPLPVRQALEERPVRPRGVLSQRHGGLPDGGARAGAQPHVRVRGAVGREGGHQGHRRAALPVHRGRPGRGGSADGGGGERDAGAVRALRLVRGVRPGGLPGEGRGAARAGPQRAVGDGGHVPAGEAGASPPARPHPQQAQGPSSRHAGRGGAPLTP